MDNSTAPKVLLIDDSRSIRMILKRMMTSLGFEVLEAENGQVGLNVLAEHNGEVAFIMVDWNMPEMNGLELIRNVRANPDYSDIWIIMVTSESEASHVSTALEDGADEYVMKPFDKDIIMEKLEMLGLLEGATR
jgi:two-component system chemotaxis response regulator CheY